MDTNADDVVAGESVLDLLPVLVAIVDQSTFERRANGMYSFSAKMPTAQLIPFKRALMRVKAELLVEDAASVRTTLVGTRTPIQREADAFADLIWRVMKARPRPSDGS
jgi:hypothetical protein